MRIPLITYLAVILILDLFQELLIFPGSRTQGKSDAQVILRAGSELVPLQTAEGVKTVAVYGGALQSDGQPRADARTCPTLLFFYGNGTSLSTALPLMEQFRRRGMNVMIPEYLGYGLAEGAPSEIGCRATAQAALAHLRTRGDIDRNRIVLAGTSLGGAVAIDLALRSDVAGLAVFSSFTSLPDVVRYQYPFLPGRWLLRHEFASRAKLAHLVNCPIFLAHGLDDEVVPHRMADELAASASGPVQVQKVAGAGHNVFDVGGPELMDQVTKFVYACPPRSSVTRP